VQLGRLGRCGLIVMPCLEAIHDVRPPLTKQLLSSPELIQRNQSGLIGVQQATLLAVKFRELLLKILDVLRHEVVRDWLGL
jgi:hypothetical protein